MFSIERCATLILPTHSSFKGRHCKDKSAQYQKNVFSMRRSFLFCKNENVGSELQSGVLFCTLKSTIRSGDLQYGRQMVPLKPLCFIHGCIMKPGYGTAAQPCFQSFPVATRGIATKNPPVAQKAFSPQTATVKETAVKRLQL